MLLEVELKVHAMSDIWSYFVKKPILTMEKSPAGFQIPVDCFQELYHFYPSVKQTKKLKPLWRDSNSLKEVYTKHRHCPSTVVVSDSPPLYRMSAPDM